MKGLHAPVIAALLLAVGTPGARGGEPRSVPTASASEVEVTGTFMNDWAFYLAEEEIAEGLNHSKPTTATDPFIDGTEFRRIRLGVKGPLSSHLAFKLEVDLSGGEAEPKDVYLAFTGLPWMGTVRVGHQFEPDARLAGSSKHLVFLEKALPSAFSAGRNTGLRVISNALGKRITASAGAFRNTDRSGANGVDEGTHLTARLTGLPLYRDSGRTLGHLGAFYSRRNPKGGAVRFRQRPEAHLAPYLVDTGGILAERVDLFGFEVAAILGPAFLHAEYLHTVVDPIVADDLRFFGYHVTGGYVLTGESRTYSRTTGSFSRLVPARDFSPSAGEYGAWMILARYSHIDLSDEAVEGSALTDISFGLNAYLNRNTRLAWNYVLADLHGIGKMQIAQMRIQVHL